MSIGIKLQNLKLKIKKLSIISYLLFLVICFLSGCGGNHQIKYGAIYVYSTDGAEQINGASVILNNEVKGVTPIMIKDIKDGIYNIKVTMGGYIDYINSNVMVTTNNTTTVIAILQFDNPQNPVFEDEFPLEVNYFWQYKQSYNANFFDINGEMENTNGTQYFISKVLGKENINNYDCFSTISMWFSGISEGSNFSEPYPIDYFSKKQDGVFKIANKDIDGDLIIYPELIKYIQSPLQVGLSWKITTPWQITYTVTKEETINTPLGDFNAYLIETQQEYFEENDYYRFWVAKNIGYIQDEANIEFDCVDMNGNFLGKGDWYQITKLINYNFPKSKFSIELNHNKVLNDNRKKIDTIFIKNSSVNRQLNILLKKLLKKKLLGNIQKITIEVYNLAGRLVDRFEDDTIDGETTWTFADKLANGVYIYRITIYRITTIPESKIGKLVIMR